MELRAELLPPVVTERQRAELEREIERVGELVRAGAPGAAAAVRAFNARTGHDRAPYDFLAYYGSRSLEEFALELARPARPKVDGVTVGELAELVRRALAAEPESEWYLRVLTVNVAHPRAVDVLFHGRDGATPEEMVAELLSYRPIVL
ncbi:hypothetical protein [Kitasatospora sp. NPDC057198]|uniref:hypothetical protein n=1 Tax=Kitasatospora sp. NPDC057198 TaxID=3346046 RepID=UPI00362937D2